MKLVVIAMVLILVSFISSCSDDKKFKECSRLKKNIETEIVKFFAAEVTADNTRLETFIEQAKKHLNRASKQANVYKVLCDE